MTCRDPDYGECDSQLAAELLNGLLRFASIDWKEAKFPVSKAIDDLGLHLLHLFPAGRAPRGEEGKQHHVALQVGQGDRCVVEHSDREVRGLLSDADERGFLFRRDLFGKAAR